MIKFVKKLIEKLLGSEKLVLNPYSNIIFVWNVLLSFLIIVMLFLIPFELSFNKKYFSNIFPIIFLSLDIILNFNTSYVSGNTMIRNRYLISKKFIEKYIIYELLSISPFILIQFNIYPNIFLKLLFIFKFKIFRKYIKNVRNKYFIGKKGENILELIDLVFLSLFMCHIFACTWHWIGNISFLDHNKTWLVHKGIQNKNIWVKYIYAFYWSATTIMTVGYGDISPQNIHETLLSTIIIFIGCGIFSYNIATIGTVLKNIRDYHTDFK